MVADFNNQIPGFKLSIPAGAANFPDGSKEGTITVTEIHPQFAPATLPDGRMPLTYMALEPDGLSFSQPVPFQFGLDPAYGFTAGAEFGFATYTHEGDYVFLGAGHAARDSLGSMIVASDPGVGLTEFSGILCFPQLTGV